jgi:hypothetical protein
MFFEFLITKNTKHVSDPLNNSAAKRINMYLRWMVRHDNIGVDLGIWDTIPASHFLAVRCIQEMLHENSF